MERHGTPMLTQLLFQSFKNQLVINGNMLNGRCEMAQDINLYLQVQYTKMPRVKTSLVQCIL